MLEKSFENKVKAFLKNEGCWYVKYWSGTARNGKQFTKDGIPDLLVCCNGFFLGVELKAEKGKPSDLQLWNIDKIREANGIAMVLYPDDFETFKRLIRKLNTVEGDDVQNILIEYSEIINKDH